MGFSHVFHSITPVAYRGDQAPEINATHRVELYYSLKPGLYVASRGVLPELVGREESVKSARQSRRAR